MRLVNIHTARLEGVGPKGAPAHVLPGDVGEFDTENASVKGWIKARLLIPEGELVASRAASLVDAPSIADLVELRAKLADRETVIADMERRAEARAAEMKRIEGRFQELAMKHADADAAASRIAELEARCAELQALVDSATAPTGDAPTGDAPPNPDETATGGRRRRTG